jgi:flagellar motor switch protein FliN/FliY
MNMKDAHVLKLDAALDAPVDVLLEGNVVARGQLVAVDDNFGVRITELPKAGAA